MEVCLRWTIRSTKKVSSAGASRIKPTTAPLWKSCWPITSLKISVASTLKLPPITFGIPKSVITSVNVTIAALINPYLAPGKVIVKNLREADVPIALAASYKRASASESAVIKIISACGNTLKISEMMIPGAP